MKMKVALFINGWNGESADSFIDGFRDFFSRDDVDLFVFASYSLTVESEESNRVEDAIYSLPDFSFFDAVIIFGSGINFNELIFQIVEKCDKAEVPVIIQGFDIEGYTSVTVDTKIGMRNLSEHLITEHGVRDAIFIAGPADNEDSNSRLSATKEVFASHGIELSDERILYANWEALIIRKYFSENYGDKKKKLPDAFICANDQMAMFVILFLEELGYKVPDDVIVTGFDNLEDGKICYPSLTTVDQSYKNQGTECAKLVVEFQKDKNLKKKSIIPCVAVPGESCRCPGCSAEIELRNKVGRLWWSERFVSDNLEGRESHLDMCIMSNERFENIHQNMNEDFFLTVGAETEDFHIYINSQYKELDYMNVPEGVVKNTSFGPVMDVIGARTGGVIYYEDTMNVNDLLLGYGDDGIGKTYVFKSLIIDNSVFGYMIMGYKKDLFKRRSLLDFSRRLDRTLKKYQRNIDDYYKTIRVQEQANEFLRQTVEALAAAVDAKDSYTNGHSYRVAKYSRKIAEECGMTEKECDDVYLAGLLHDVGKIGIDDNIINKKGKLTDEEFAIIKLHPVMGGQILSKIVMSPSLSVGAHYHHERYDGRGYPDRLKGDEIPRIARIIAVADAYDAMTSMRSYRNMMPQMQVREEIIKGIGTQFDPEYGKIMLNLLDKDEAYSMKESKPEDEMGLDTSYKFENYKTNVSTGIRITNRPVTVKLQYKPLRNGGQPTLLFYDSADERYYLEDSLIAGEMDFVEFVSIDLNGSIYPDYIRKYNHNSNREKEIRTESDKTYVADVFMVKQDDHLFVRITADGKTDEMTFALYDASRYLYLALTGEFCVLDILDVNVSSDAVEKNYISRIAEKIVYTDGPVGDIPNVQIDGWISNHSEVVEIGSDMNVTFHSISLPSSRRVWHCPIVALFTSDDGEIGGSNFKELAYIRLDGEAWCDNPEVSNEFFVTKNEEFDNWSSWKTNNKSGVDCKMTITKKDNVLDVYVEDSGLITKNRTTLQTDISKIYFYLTGDQCAITNINIDKN